MALWSREQDALTVRALGAPDRERALDLCRRDRVASVLAAVRVRALAAPSAFGEVLGVWEHGRLVALCWAGANLVPVAPAGEGLTELAAAVRERGRRCSSVVGDAAAVLELWDGLAPAWSVPREIRAAQPSMVIATEAQIPPAPGVRLSQESDLELLVPAAVAMFTEEYGYSPLASGGAYEARVRQLVAAGHSFVLIDRIDGRPQVAFKAELGAVALGVAQVQGVWVHPRLRGRGMGSAGMSAVVALARERGADLVSLYVNSWNAPALAVYRKVGFRQVGEYATVVF